MRIRRCGVAVMSTQPAQTPIAYGDITESQMDEIKSRLWTKWEHVAGDLSVCGDDTTYTGADVAEIIGDLVAYTDLSDISWDNTPTIWWDLDRDARKRILTEVFPPEVVHHYN
jgi:hypothetical protein